MMGVPMVAGGTLIAVLHVGSLTPRQLVSHDSELLSDGRGPRRYGDAVDDGPS
jgi:hypothetical protein